MSTTYSITTINDWYTAIGDSQLPTPVYTTYLLTTNLTFTSTNPPFLTSTTTPSGSNGTVDTDYLYISAGQTFNGQGYLITLNNGCEPTGGMAGIFRALGVSGNTANFINININGASGLPLAPNIGSIFISSISATYDPFFVNIQYGIIQCASDISTTLFWVIGCNNDSSFIMDSVYMNLTGNVSSSASQCAFVGASAMTLTNCIFQITSIFGSMGQAFINYIGGGAGVGIINNCYFIITVSTDNIASIIYNLYTTSFTMTNTYIVYTNDYSTIYNNTGYLIQNNNGGGTVSNLYTNLSSFSMVLHNYSTPIISSNINNSYTWTSPPTFSEPSAWNSSVSPYLLNVFKNGPFLSSVYTAYNISPSFIPPPVCFNKGTLILTYGGAEEVKDVWKPVENLKKGDLVKTYLHGYRRIDTIISSEIENNYDSLFECMYRLPKTKDMTEDLIVSGGHSIMEDELPQNVLEMYEMNNWFDGGKDSMIDDKHMVLACLSDKFEKIQNSDTFEIYHFSLENEGDGDRRFLVWANHVLTETPSQNFLEKSLQKI